MFLRSIAASVIVAYLSGSVAAVAAPVMIISYGSNNCERFIRAPNSEKKVYLAWTEGFISGINIGAVGDQRMLGLFWKQSANTAWLQDYCSKNPQQNFLFAVEALRVSIGGRNR